MPYRKHVIVHISQDPAILGYVAGIIDGEGHIGIVNSFSKRKSRYPSAALRVVITNTDARLIDWLSENVGGSVRKEDRAGLSAPPPRAAHWKPVYRWDVHATNARTLLTAVLPYLVIKREQAELALAFLDLPAVWGRWKVASDETRAAREVIRQKLLVLTKRGPPTVVT